MNTKIKSIAEVATVLAGDSKIQKGVENEMKKSKVTKALLLMRIEKGITQKQIAQHMKCSQSKISKIEAGNDMSLEFKDILDYATSLGIEVAISFEDKSLPVSKRIKQHIFALHGHLETLANIAKEVEDDSDIVDKIHQFYGEVLLNFLIKFGDSYSKVNSIVANKQDVKITESITNKKPKTAKKKYAISSGGRAAD